MTQQNTLAASLNKATQGANALAAGLNGAAEVVGAAFALPVVSQAPGDPATLPGAMANVQAAGANLAALFEAAASELARMTGTPEPLPAEKPAERRTVVLPAAIEARLANGMVAAVPAPAEAGDPNRDEDADDKDDPEGDGKDEPDGDDESAVATAPTVAGPAPSANGDGHEKKPRRRGGNKKGG